MKIQLSDKELDSVKILLKSKDENILVSDLLMDYLTVKPRLVNMGEVRHVMASSTCSQEDAFLRILTERLCSDGKDQNTRSTLLNHLGGKVTKLEPKRYIDNPYFKNISLPDYGDGKWSIRHREYAPFEGFAYLDTALDGDSFVEITHLGYFEKSFIYPAILESNSVWMSITPHEIETMASAIKEVKGNVVVFGLGLGYFAYMASLKDEVARIVVIERDHRLIDLFNKHILPQFKHKEKIVVIEMDAFVYAKTALEEEMFSYAFVDIYRSVDDGLPLFLRMKKLEAKSPDTKFIYWLGSSLLAMVRRVVLTIIEEIIDGYKDQDFQRALTKEDRLFAEVFARLPKEAITGIDGVKRLLSDEALSALLRKAR